MEARTENPLWPACRASGSQEISRPNERRAGHERSPFSRALAPRPALRWRARRLSKLCDAGEGFRLLAQSGDQLHWPPELARHDRSAGAEQTPRHQRLLDHLARPMSCSEIDVADGAGALRGHLPRPATALGATLEFSGYDRITSASAAILRRARTVLGSPPAADG